MSTYFIADIHGEYDLFIKLLDKIKFHNTDSLYILGDIIDKGKDSIKLLKYIANKPNIFAIMGNHEYTFLQYIKGIIEQTPKISKPSLLEKANNYFPNNLDKLSIKELQYILDLPYYIETDDFICIHAGLEILDNNILPLSQQTFYFMLFDRNFKNANFTPLAKTILYGHTPCIYDQPDGKFIKKQKPNTHSHTFDCYSSIRLDTGVSITNILGILRKEDMAEFYIKKH